MFFLVMSLTPLKAWSGEITYKLTNDAINLSKSFSYSQTNEQTNITDIKNTPSIQWTPNPNSSINFGLTNKVYWFKHKFYVESPVNQPVVFEISYPLLDFVDIFIEHDNKTFRYKLGDKYAFKQRPTKNRLFVIPFVINPKKPVQMYMKVKTTSVFIFNMNLYKHNVFYQKDQITNLLYGAYLGSMSLLLIYVISCAYLTKEPLYLYYIGYIVSVTALITNTAGLNYQHLWPELIWWNDKSNAFIQYLMLLFGSLFTVNLLSLKYNSPKIYLLIRYLFAVFIFGLLTSLLLPYSYMSGPTLYLSLAVCIFGICIGYLRFRDGVDIAKYYSIAWMGPLLGGIILVLSRIAILPYSWVTDYALMLGLTFEVICFSYAMAKSLNTERKSKTLLNNQLAEHLEDAKVKLEQEVSIRTEELNNLNLKLLEASNTDSLTGIANRRRLESYLDVEYARAVRFNYSICILMVDIDHFKSINDSYGHQVGDECLRKVANKIAQCITRVGDLTARYGGEEFCVVLPYTDEQEGETIAQNIRNTIGNEPILTSVGKIPVTVSIGVAGHIPKNLISLSHMEFADKALFLAKKLGRNRVIMADKIDLNTGRC